MNPFLKRARHNQIDLVIRDPSNILTIKDPCDEAVFIALKKDSSLISKIHLSEKLQKQFVADDPRLVLFMKQPLEKTILNAIIREPKIIYFLSNPSYRIKTLAVKYIPRVAFDLNFSLEFKKQALFYMRRSNPYKERANM